MAGKKTIYYMRHFEAMHNIKPYNFNLRDPELSPLAQTQAPIAVEVMQKIPVIDLVVCSPLRRTLQTYLLVFANRRDIPLIIHPDLQEACSEPCDIGSPLSDMRVNFPMLASELDTLEQTFAGVDWLEKNDVESIYSPKQLAQRAKRASEWLLNRPEKHIFVVSHNLMLQELIPQENGRKVDLNNGDIKPVEY